MAQRARYRSKPDWFVWKLTLLGCFAAASATVVGVIGLVVGGDYDRSISAAMFVVGIVGSWLLWRYLRKPIDPEER